MLEEQAMAAQFKLRGLQNFRDGSTFISTTCAEPQ